MPRLTLEVRIVDVDRRVLALVSTETRYSEACIVADLLRERMHVDAVVRVKETGAIPYDSRAFNPRRRSVPRARRAEDLEEEPTSAVPAEATPPEASPEPEP